MSEAEAIQQQETEKKKKLSKEEIEKLKKAKIEKRKRMMPIRKRLRMYISPINYKALKVQISNDIAYKALVRQLRTHERRKLIFNLLIKAWFSSKKQGQIKCKFGLTSIAAEIASKIDIVMINKYHFIIKNLDINKEWAIHFRLILCRQFSDHRYPEFPTRIVYQTKKNRFILEKEFYDQT